MGLIQIKKHKCLIYRFSFYCLFYCLLFLLNSSLHAKIIPIREIFEPSPVLYPSDKYQKVAVIQWAPDDDAPLGSDFLAQKFKRKNRGTLASYIRQAAANGAKLIVTPEFAIVGYPDIPELPDELDNFRSRQDLKPYVETVPGPTSSFFSKLAKELKVYLHIGLAQVDPQNDDYYNTVIAISPQGKIVAQYHKIQLFHNESDYLVPGEDISVYKSIFGRVGIIICADVWADFPMNDYASASVRVLALSTSWANYNTGWDYFVEGAQWVQAYFLAANQNYFPDSGVLNPDGTTQSHIRQTTGIAYGYLPVSR